MTLAFYQQERGLSGVLTESRAHKQQSRAHKQLLWLLLWDQMMDPCVPGMCVCA